MRHNIPLSTSLALGHSLELAQREFLLERQGLSLLLDMNSHTLDSSLTWLNTDWAPGPARGSCPRLGWSWCWPVLVDSVTSFFLFLEALLEIDLNCEND